MKKNNPTGNNLTEKVPIKHFLLIMRTTFILLFICVFCSMAEMSYTQNARVTINKRNVTLREVLNEIESQTDYLFIYNDKVNTSEKVSVKANHVSVYTVLSSLLKEKGVKHSMEGNHIILKTIEKESDADKEKLHLAVQQQKKQIVGKVTDLNGEPIIGANVIEIGTTNGTITDIDGNFSLNVEENANIRITYIGYLEQEIRTTGKANFIVSMQEDTQTLDELVVVGYGTMRKSDITGAIGSVKSDDLLKISSNNVDQIIQGRVPGVVITGSSGAPGRGSDVRIRGVGTLNNSSPLYVVDGIPMGHGNINYLSPNDIKSIEILKDASSAAIYGSQAANGVILVTTNKGESGIPKITFNAYYGLNFIQNKIDMLSAQDYINYLSESFSNDGSTLEQSLPAYISAQDEINQGILSPSGYDQWNIIKNKSSNIQNYYIGVSGGNDKITYNLSTSYHKNIGLIRYSDYEHLTGKLSTIFNIRKGIDLGINLQYYSSKTGNVPEGAAGLGGSVYNRALIYDPTVAPFDSATGSPNITRHQSVGIQHPEGQIWENKDDWSKEYRLLLNPSLKWEFIKGLIFNTNFAFTRNNPRSFDFTPEYFISSAQTNTTARIAEVFQNNWNYYLDNTLTWVKDLGNLNHITVMGGMSLGKSFSERISVQKSGLPGDGSDKTLWSMDNATLMEVIEAQPNGFSPNTSTRASFFERINYNMGDKYLFQFSLRADGSSNLGPKSRWGYFPSASGAWRITQENFMSNTSKWLTDLKLRLGYGVLGNDNIGSFKYATTLNTVYTTYPFGPGGGVASRSTIPYGVLISSTGNENLKWESTTQLNAGIDFGFFNNTLTGSFDIYQRKTKDILINLPVSGVSGLTSYPTVNGGNMLNEGIEIILGYQNNIGNFYYNVTTNLGTVKNRVTSLGFGGQPIYSNKVDKRDSFSKTDINYPIAYFWGYKVDGIFQSEEEVKNHVGPSGKILQPLAKAGDLRFTNLNNDDIIDDSDKTYLGDPTPGITYGLNIDLSWKNFDFSMFWNGAADFQLVNFTTSELNWHGYSNVAKEIYDKRWTGSGTSNSVPRLTFDDLNSNLLSNSSRFVEDADYIRLRNIEFGHTFKMASLNIEKLRIYVSGQNILTFTKFMGQDPEIGTRAQGGNSLDLGMAFATYPQSRSIVFGVNVIF